MTDYANSAKLADAQELWFSKSRTRTGNLPRCGYWTLSNATAEQRLLLMDTDYFCFFVSGDAINYPLIGTTPLKTYAAENDIPILVRDGGYKLWQRSTSNSTYAYRHPFYGSTGTFIGDNVDDGIGSNSQPDFGYERQYRFYDLVADDYKPGTYISITDQESPIVYDDRFLIPYFDGNEEIFRKGTEHTWYFDPVYGGAHHQDQLDPLVPVGVLIDWEDTTWYMSTRYALNPAETGHNTYSTAYTMEEIYYNDGTFDPISRTYARQHKIQEQWAKMIEARRLRVEELFQTTYGVPVEPLQSFVYDSYLTDLPYILNGPTIMNAYGRPRGSYSIYPYSGHVNYNVPLTFNSLGYTMARAAHYGWHLIDGWTLSAGSSTDVLSGEVNDPQAYGRTRFQTIGQLIATSKCLMALGAIKLAVYIESTSPRHQWWSTIIAYDEMQPYHEIIKYGSNYVPPSSIARPLIEVSQYDVNGQFRGEAKTLFYGKDYYGTEIPQNEVYICCRTYQNTMMFYGCSLDASNPSGEYDIKAPDGSKVRVAYSQMGEVTIV